MPALYHKIGGQQVLSPYHAMACNPAMMVDPLGLRSSVFDNGARSANPPVDPLADIKAMFPTINMYLPGGSLFNAGNMARNSMMEESQTRLEVLTMLYKLDDALGSLGYESASLNATLGRVSGSGDVKQNATDNGNTTTITEIGRLGDDDYTVVVTANRPSKVNWLDWVQGGLDVVGLVPGLGEIADGANALIYLGRGDYTNAALSAAAMIPIVGTAATGGKYINKARKGTEIFNAVNTGKRTGSAAYKSLNVDDAQHFFSNIVDNYASLATKFSLKGGDGVVRDLYQIERALRGKSGIFEWIVDGANVTHRRFISGGKVNGIPNQIVK